MSKKMIPAPPTEPTPSKVPDKAAGRDPISVRIGAAVKLTGIGRTTLFALIKSGKIEAVKVGRSTLIPYRSLRQLLEPPRDDQDG
jgi:excisionase family DNA binding protein